MPPRSRPSIIGPRERTLLTTEPVGRLATVSSDGRPHLVPVCFALIETPDATLVAVSIDEKPKRTTELVRLTNLRRDPRATLLVDHYEADWARLAWVRLDLTGEVLESGDRWPVALAALRARYPQYRAMAIQDRPILRLRPVKVVSWFADD